MEYNIEHIRALVGRWLAGETTLAEEAALREFFAEIDRAQAGGEDGRADGVQNELPADLQPFRLLFGQSAGAEGERSRRKLILHTEPTHKPTRIPHTEAATAATNPAKQNITPTPHTILRRPAQKPLRRWIAATAGIAAAVAVGVALFVTPEHTPQNTLHNAPQSDILCVVNGVHITDPGEIVTYTREALEIASHNLQKPGQALSSTLGNDPALVRVGEMLNELTKNQ